MLLLNVKALEEEVFKEEEEVLEEEEEVLEEEDGDFLVLCLQQQKQT